MSDPRESDAVSQVSEILAFPDNQEFDVQITPVRLGMFLGYLSDKNSLRERMVFRVDTESGVPSETYSEHLFPILISKIIDAVSGKEKLRISYREIDAVVMDAFGVAPEYGWNEDDQIREKVRIGKYDISLILGFKETKHAIREILEAFVGAGGNDRHGYLEAFQRVSRLRVENAEWGMDDPGPFLVEDEDQE